MANISTFLGWALNSQAAMKTQSGRQAGGNTYFTSLFLLPRLCENEKVSPMLERHLSNLMGQYYTKDATSVTPPIVWS